MPAAVRAPRLVRLLIVVATLLLALAATRAALVAWLARSDPAAALRWDPGYAPALAVTNDLRLLRTDGAIDPAPFAAAARRALRSEPLNAMALRQLALVADVAGARDRARRLIALGTNVSRRDLGTHVWTIEDRAGAGDIQGALRAYDIALTTVEDAPKLLYPVLSAALGDPTVRAAFGRYLDQKRPWMAGFLNYAIAANDDPGAIATLVLAHGGLLATTGYAALEPQLLGRLVVRGQFDAARRYALSMPDGRGGTLDDAGFTAQTTAPALGVLAWQLADDAELEARRDGGEDLLLRAEPDARREMATRTLLLPPGRFRFAFTVAPPGEGEAAPLGWTLLCLGKPSVPPTLVWQQDLPAVRAPQHYGVPIVLPPGCRAQRLSLTITGSDLQDSSGDRVSGVTLLPTTP